MVPRIRFRTAVEFLWACVFGVLLSLGAAQSDTVVKPRGEPIVEVHLVLFCGSPFWQSIADAARASLNFTTDTCFETTEGANAAVDGILSNLPSAGRAAIIGSPMEASGLAESSAPFARAAKAGLPTFLVEMPINTTKYGIDFEQDLILQFRPNNLQGSIFIGEELCRRSGLARTQRVAALYGADPAFDVRVDTALATFQERCPDTQLIVATSQRGDWSAGNARELFESVFLTDTTISAVLSTNDGMALGVVQAADFMLESAQARSILVSGFDNIEAIRPLMTQGRVFATVDQLTTVPGVGIWNTLPKVVQLVSERGWQSTAAVQRAVDGLDGMLFSTNVMARPSDMEGYLLTKLLASYNKKVRPLPVAPGHGGATAVMLGIHEVVLETIDVPSNTFDATFWVQLTWYDMRLEWPVTQYNGTLEIPPEDVWTPEIYVVNHLSPNSEAVTGNTLVTVRNTGLTNFAVKFTGSFDCAMRIEPYPFDMHQCYINVTVASDRSKITLDGEDGFTISAWEEGYRVRETSDVGIVYSLTGNESPIDLTQSAVTFPFAIERIPTFVMNGYVMLGWMLVVLSMMQFWIPEETGNMDRAGLAITTVLASTVLQTEAAASKTTTWLSYFFNICTAYQTISFFVTIIAGRRLGQRELAAKNEELATPRTAASSREHSSPGPALEVDNALAEDGVEVQLPAPDSRRVLKNLPHLPNLASVISVPLSRPSIMISAKRNNKLKELVTTLRQITGKSDDDLQDFFAIRMLVPSYLLICMILPFFTLLTCGGDNCPTSNHPEAGARTYLFLTNAILLSLWLVAFCISNVIELGGYDDQDR